MPAADGITYRGMGGELVLEAEPGGGLVGSYPVAFERVPEAPARGPQRLVIGGTFAAPRNRLLWRLRFPEVDDDAAQGAVAALDRARRRPRHRGLSAPLLPHRERADRPWGAVPAAEPRVGDVARFCMRPEQARLTAGRPYAGGRRGGLCSQETWMPAKPVVAVAGDTVVHTPEAVSVNGHELPLSSTRTHDSRGLPVPTAEYGTFVLTDGEFWMHSPYADGSFDSRTWAWYTETSCMGRCGRWSPG